MKKWVGGLVTVSALLLSGGVMAQGYASFAAGQSQHVDTCSGFPSCDESGTAFKVVGGYNITEVLGLEIGYLDFGKAKASGFGITAELLVSALTVGGSFKANFTPDAIFGLPLPNAVPGVPAEVLNPRATWKDGAAYDAAAKKLAKLFRENDAKFEMPAEVRSAGPRG